MARRDNSRTALGLGAIVAVMVSLSFAAVPLYDWFCRVTGYGGTTAVAVAGADAMLERTITVRFDANTAPGMPWTFRPMARTMELRIGETALAFYEAENLSDEPVAGTASFNVAPYSAGSYFTKIACFCFDLQVLGPGERVEMPVTFYVHPAMVDDPEAGGLNAVTLSYTMHRADLPEEAASLPQPRYAAAISGGAATAQ
jgi:cytochrome c oxidase assembly protein subunit 11